MGIKMMLILLAIFWSRLLGLLKINCWLIFSQNYSISGEGRVGGNDDAELLWRLALN
jgi:hypothetical protein